MKNEEVIVPNAQLPNGVVGNDSPLAAANGPIVPVVVGIGYETRWRQGEAMLGLAAGRTAGLPACAPSSVCSSSALSPSTTSSTWRWATRALDDVRTALAQNVLGVCNEYGVQVMTPACEGDPAAPKVVKRADWRLAPAPPAPGA